MPGARGASITVLAAVLIGGCAPGGPPDRVPAPGDGAFVVRYEKPDGRALRTVAADLKGDGVVESTVEALNDFVLLPGDIGVVVRSCDGGALYDPSKREIQICLEDVLQTRELLADADAEDLASTERGVLVDTVNHEAGHALLDVYAMEFTGREEDVADQFSAFVSVRAGDQGLDDLEAAAYAYELSAAAYEEDPTDEHASDAQRAVNYQCWVYGTEKRDSTYLVDTAGLTKRRAEFCWQEWGDLKNGWLRLLKRADAFRAVTVPSEDQ